jgi:hypothetical protein
MHDSQSIRTALILGALMASAVLISPTTARAQQQPQQGPKQPMGFFVTSRGAGDGANLGGLAGADKYCQTLAAAAGAGNRTWRAYLSVTAFQTTLGVNARDRIGNGPWYNARGELIAANVADLHGDFEHDRNNIRKPSAVDEKGQPVKGVGDMPNEHDILTGSDSHGRSMVGRPQFTTCNNWTSNAAGSAIVGHHDRLGGANSSWNAAHGTAGCSQQDLVSTGGAGLLYCFAAD